MAYLSPQPTQFVCVCMQPLMEAGLDSLGAVELRDALGARFGVELPAMATFDHPTPAALAAYMLAAVRSRTYADVSVAAATLSPGASGLRVSTSPAASALVSVACRFPAPAAGGVHDFFRAAAAAADLPTQAPHARWAASAVYSPEPAAGRLYARCAAYVAGIDRFDAACFGMASAEALATDPQQRLLLEEAAAAVAAAPGGAAAWMGAPAGARCVWKGLATSTACTVETAAPALGPLLGDIAHHARLSCTGSAVSADQQETEQPWLFPSTGNSAVKGSSTARQCEHACAGVYVGCMYQEYLCT